MYKALNSYNKNIIYEHNFKASPGILGNADFVNYTATRVCIIVLEMYDFGKQTSPFCLLI